ncbi:hypothetical protein CCHL11_08629 [Colletotrichum chlorophyti]|uniref:Extracellular membrane protein CFEM domain-containing protein n=1 Tax=Colletotrichum chlorophyti TaxID=708187 RepID=A0A1Q8RCL4_9PEZI|nr:hypothetical protein CCHL11_08629 [Colletotrichum chlorophyti]
MQLNVVTGLTILLAMQPVAARFCALNAIECTYDSGRRCAKWCPQVACECANFKDNYGNLASAKCISEVEWLGRHKCG